MAVPVAVVSQLLSPMLQVSLRGRYAKIQVYYSHEENELHSVAVVLTGLVTCKATRKKKSSAVIYRLRKEVQSSGRKQED